MASVREGPGELCLGENSLADFRAVSIMDSEEWEQTGGKFFGNAEAKSFLGSGL